MGDMCSTDYYSIYLQEEKGRARPATRGPVVGELTVTCINTVHVVLTWVCVYVYVCNFYFNYFGLSY